MVGDPTRSGGLKASLKLSWELGVPGLPPTEKEGLQQGPRGKGVPRDTPGPQGSRAGLSEWR